MTVGFHFDYAKKVYWTGLLEVAREFERFADLAAKAKFGFVERQMALSSAVTSSLSIPSPKDLEYMPFQVAGVQYILPRRDVLLADEMGTGKTIQVCGVINADPSIRNILVVCPNSLRINWLREFQKWLIRRLTGSFALGESGLYTLAETNIVIINYEMVKKFRDEIDKRHWDLLAVDEAHYCKNPESQRSRYVMGNNYGDTKPIAAERRLYLTGTPLVKRPIDLWPYAKVCDPKGLGLNYNLFGKRYCKGEIIGGQLDFSGASNLEELNKRLRSTFMLRRLKKDVMPELPPKRRQIIPLPNPGIRAIADELEFYNRNEEIIERAKYEAERAQSRGDEASYKYAAQQLRAARQVEFKEMAALRYKTAMAKIPFAIQYIENALEQQDKIIVFARHRDVINKIVERFSSISTWMHGDKTVPQRQQAVDRFQDDPNCKIIVGSFDTMGEGWTLTAASYLLFVELDWTAKTLTQAEDRAHRKGQLESLLIQHLVFDNSLDANQAKRCIKEQDIADKAVN